MLYLYSISTALSYIFLIILLIRVLINKNNINFKSNKYDWQLLISLIIVSIVPMVNMFFAISSAYIAILMKHDNFIQLMNE
jgi:Na+-driven multidrug efflux pump